MYALRRKMMSTIYYLNGEFVSADEATLPLNDLAIVRGYGVFDYLRTYNGGKPFHLDEHIQRLARSAEQIKLQLPNSLSEIYEIVHETIEKNSFEEAGIRLVVTGGTSPSFFTPTGDSTLAVMLSPAPTYPEENYTEGTKIITVKTAREYPTVKSLNYIGAIVAMKEADAAGAIEAVYLDANDNLTEATRCNFVGVKGNTLITAAENVLDGITRNVVITLAAEQPNLEIEMRSLPYAEIEQLDEAFITSSTKEVMPVTIIDDLTVGTGRPGPVTNQLHDLFRTYADSI